jgi:hypothetical protein
MIDQHSPTARAVPGDVLTEPPIYIDPRVAQEIERAHAGGQQGEFRVRVITDDTGDNLQFEFSWDEPTREDFGLKLPNGELVLIDGLTLAFMFDTYDLIYTDTYRVARKDTKNTVSKITPNDVDSVIRGDLDLVAELEKHYRP